MGNVSKSRFFLKTLFHLISYLVFDNGMYCRDAGYLMESEESLQNLKLAYKSLSVSLHQNRRSLEDSDFQFFTFGLCEKHTCMLQP